MRRQPNRSQSRRSASCPGGRSHRSRTRRCLARPGAHNSAQAQCCNPPQSAEHATSTQAFEPGTARAQERPQMKALKCCPRSSRGVQRRRACIQLVSGAPSCQSNYDFAVSLK
eukprot:15473311-Alexandrium_andersonii.AAC.1